MAVPPVATSTVTLPGELTTTISLAGLKLHAALAGSVPHRNVNVPEEPLMVVNTNVKVAVCRKKLYRHTRPVSGIRPPLSKNPRGA